LKIAFFCLDKLYGQASRSISTGQLNASLRLHLQPINLVVCEGPSALAGGRSYLGLDHPATLSDLYVQPLLAVGRVDPFLIDLREVIEREIAVEALF